MKRYGAVLLLLFALVVAVEADSLQNGTSRNAVLQKMGQPDTVEQRGDLEILVYEGRSMSGFSIDRQDFSAVLKDGKLVKSGIGSVSISKSGAVSTNPD